MTMDSRPRRPLLRTLPPETLRLVRERLGLTRDQLSAEFQYSAGTLRDWERRGAPRLVRLGLTVLPLVPRPTGVRIPNPWLSWTPEELCRSWLWEVLWPEH